MPQCAGLADSAIVPAAERVGFPPLTKAYRVTERTHILILRCPDTRGIVAAVAGYLAQHSASIVESHHFNDSVGDLFCMRTVFRADGAGMPGLAQLRSGFELIAEGFTMTWAMHDVAVRPRVLIAVSRQGHCLFDLLHRWRAGQIAIDVVGVVSNHEEMRSFVEWNGLPYHHLPVSDANRDEQEAALLALVHDSQVDLVVLARYMQVLSPQLCAALAGRCINIHHSFLPSFRGARPYQQAHERGVKIIGATAHYVTTDLDEGPIIEQAVERVTHAHTPQRLMEIGRDIECAVLARAVRWHVERRVMLQDRRTIVFS